jgi:DNA-binding response OmpR family regulator
MAATVLVVDDDSMIRDLYATWLGREYEVRTAADGEAALSLVDDDVDVILLDRRMPGMRGDNALNRLRERNVDCRVVMVSAVDPDVEVLDLPFDDYLVKPAEDDDLSTAVTVALERAELGETERAYVAVLAKLGLLETHHTGGAESVRETLHDRRSALGAELGERAGGLDERAAAGELVLQAPTVVHEDG